EAEPVDDDSLTARWERRGGAPLPVGSVLCLASYAGRVLRPGPPEPGRRGSGWLCEAGRCFALQANALLARDVKVRAAHPAGPAPRPLVARAARPDRGGCPTSPGRRACT